VVHVDLMSGMLTQGLKEKVQQSPSRGSSSNNFGYVVDQIGRNMGGGGNNQSLSGHINEAAKQLLHDFTSIRNTSFLYCHIIFIFFTHITFISSTQIIYLYNSYNIFRNFIES
jgi:hypothetical protein